MNNPANSLFSDLSPNAASQSKGGHGNCCYSSCYKSSVVRVRYYPVSYHRYYHDYSSHGHGGSRSTINITNPDFDDGSIVNF